MVKNDRKMKHALKWEKLFKFKNEQEYVAKHIKKVSLQTMAKICKK